MGIFHFMADLFHLKYYQIARLRYFGDKCIGCIAGVIWL